MTKKRGGREYRLVLRCEECGRTAAEEEATRRWQARLVGIAEDGEDEEVAIFCPECAEREFGKPDGE